MNTAARARDSAARRCLAIAALWLVLAPGLALGGGPEGLPPGLEAFLDARVAEAANDVQRALALYRRALEAEPDNVEIRISYAALQVDLGMGPAALRTLAGYEEQLDWYGRRTLALALAQAARSDRSLLPRAEKVLAEVAAARPDDAQLHAELATVLLAAGRPARAERILAGLRRYRPGSPRLAILHARALRALGRTPEAEAALRACAEPPRAFPQCVDELERLYLETGRPAEAGELLLATGGARDVERLLQAASHLLDGGRPDRALEAARSAARAAPDEPRAAMLEAEALQRMGRRRRAMARLEEFLRAHPDEAGPRIVLASMLVAEGEVDRARRELEIAWRRAGDGGRTPMGVQVCLAGARLELAADRPGAARGWLGRIAVPRLAGTDLPLLLAETYRRRGEFREGVAALLRLEPDLRPEARWVASALEGELRLRDGDREGLRTLERVVEKGDLEGVLVAVDALQGLERWDEVLDLAGRALERFPGHRGLRFARAAALERLGRHDEAAAVFEKLLEEDPDDAAVANYLGYMWADRGRNLERALELIRRAVELEPGVPAYLDSLGWVHYRLGHLEEAERWLRRALELGATDGTVLAHLGEVLLARGKSDEARRYLERALDLGCEHPEHVRELLGSLGRAGR